jgi:hypothetical protein
VLLLLLPIVVLLLVLPMVSLPRDTMESPITAVLPDARVGRPNARACDRVKARPA